MSCAACSTRVEKAVKNLDMNCEVSVSLLTNSMSVDSQATDKEIISAVKKAGYKAKIVKGETISDEDFTQKEQILNLLKRLIISSLLSLTIIYISVGQTMLKLPIPNFLNENPNLGIAEMVLSFAVIIINKKFFISGFRAIVHLTPNMDTLVSLGSGISFLYSTYNLIAISEKATNTTSGLYFESSAMILTLITVGKLLEAYSKGKTTNALKSLIKLAPKYANIIYDEGEKSIPCEKLKIGDIVAIRPGQTIPCDGIICEGSSAVNESSLTGESMPVDKEKNDYIYTGTLNINGFIKCKVTKTSDETFLSKIIKMVSDASASKAPIAKIADKVSGVFVPCVLFIAFITSAIWLLKGQCLEYSLTRGISVLVISCPCALGLATPVAIMVGNGIGAKNGILFKNAVSLENADKIKTIVFDKTGTITKGVPTVAKIIPFNDTSEYELIKNAYSLESCSEHPLAIGICDYAKKRNIDKYGCENFSNLSGSGVTAVINACNVTGASYDYISKNFGYDLNIENLHIKLSNKGMTPVYFVSNNVLMGVIALMDEIKEESTDTIYKLKNMGIHTVLLTGDNDNTAKAIGEKIKIDKVIANVKPDEKAEVINSLKKRGKIAMVGDGINDAPSLTCADIGIAIASGTDIAIESADIVLMKSNLNDIVKVINLSRKVIKNIYENLFWAFIYNLICIPLACGCFTGLGITLTPMFGALAMSLSSFCVIMNALRLNLFKFNKK